MSWDRERGFVRALEVAFEHEGGWSNHRADRGGKTMFGITEETWRLWQGAMGLKEKPVGQVTRAEAAEVYRLWYWAANRCGEFASGAVAIEVFDTTVNVGMGAAGRMVQRACNFLRSDQAVVLKEDGVIGPRTVEVVNGLTGKYERAVLAALNGEQYAFYKALVKSDASQGAFARGWAARCMAKAA